VRGLGIISCALLWLLPVSLRAQSGGSAIDAANTDAQVEQLVRSADEDYDEFVVNSALTFADKRVERLYRKARVKAWVKADIDGNGRTDLLVTGSLHGNSRVVWLLDMGDDHLKFEAFRRGYGRCCPIAKLTHDGTQVLLSYVDFERPFYVNEPLAHKQEFVLVYKYGGFIEYNKRRQQARPDSLTYESIFAYHKIDQSKLVLNADGRAEYRACEWPVLDKTRMQCEALQTQVDARALADLLDLVQYIGVSQLRPEYEIGGNHVPHAQLTFSFGTTKVRVDDQGEAGTFGLQRLYSLLGQLRQTQQWQPIK
jgi:hypothetical protein